MSDQFNDTEKAKENRERIEQMRKKELEDFIKHNKSHKKKRLA
jgi:hypothetical protein